MKLSFVAAITLAAAPTLAEAQRMGGSYPQASTFSTNRSADAPSSFVKPVPNPLQAANGAENEICLQRKRNHSVICRTRAQWEQIAARLAAKD